jgi:hypothetical protein
MKRLKIPVVCFALLVFLSCNSNPTNVVDPTPGFSRFPLTTGSTWHYEKELYSYNPRPSTLTLLDTFRATGKGYITGDTVINGITVKVMKNELYEYDITFTNLSYYLDTDTAMLRVAYNGVGMVGFGPDSYSSNNEEKYFYKYNNKIYNSLKEISFEFYNDIPVDNPDFVIIEDPPAVMFKYPVVINDQWLYKVVDTNFIIYRKYIGYENILTPGMLSRCIKVQRIIPHFGNNNFMYDYYSERGPVKRDYQFKDIVFMNEFGQELGLIDFGETQTLTGY